MARTPIARRVVALVGLATLLAETYAAAQQLPLRLVLLDARGLHPVLLRRPQEANGIIRPVKMARGGADKMLVHTLDAHLSVIAIGIAAGTTEDGIVEVHSICEIKIFRLPEIDNWRDANPGRFEI